MDNLAAESVAIQANMANALEATERAGKMRALQIQIDQKQKEKDETGTLFMWQWEKRAALQKEIDSLKQQQNSLKNASGLSGGVSGISSYAVGTPYVPSDRLAYVHKGEAIIPASQNNGGAKTADVYIQIDGQTIIRAIGQPLVETIRSRTGIKI